MNGAVRLAGVTLSARGTPPPRVAQADVQFSGSTIAIQPFVAVSADNQSARVKASYDFSEHSLRAALASEEMSIAAFRKVVVASQMPLLSGATSGTWSGEDDYGLPGWSGDRRVTVVAAP